MVVRPGRDNDRDEVAAIQRASPEASSWDPWGYDVTVAEIEDRIVGFLVTHRLAVDELEILNLAVAPSNRRKGVAKALVSASLEHVCGSVFLEVRESNLAARQLYESIGFKEVNRRPQYYSDSQEAAIVMNFHSC